MTSLKSVPMSPHLVIALVAAALMILLAIVTTIPTYRVAPGFLIPILFAVYFFRRRLNMPPLHYALFAVALLLHNCGALGWYQKWPLNFSFDILVHFYFAFAAAFILFRAIETNVPGLRPWHCYTATFFFMMGFGAIHEIMEYVSTLLLGERGMLKTTGYVFDTQRDLVNNLLGVSLALLIIGFTRRLAATWPETASSSTAP
jgi:uncharacterized membrane protein YjdF